MPHTPPLVDELSMPVLLRHARDAYASAMRDALSDAGYDDIPANGLHLIGGLARRRPDRPMSQLVAELGVSKQAASQLVDMLVLRGYLQRDVDPEDRRRLNIALTDRGLAAAKVIGASRAKVDALLAARAGRNDVECTRRTLAALMDIRHAPCTEDTHSHGASMHILSATPQLRTTDLDASIRFYTRTLGLVLEFRHADFYAGIRAGTQCFHLKLVDERDPTIDFIAQHEHFHLYLQTDDATAAAAQLQRDGVPLVRDVHDTEWGTREFVIHDDQGHTLYFSESI